MRRKGGCPRHAIGSTGGWSAPTGAISEQSDWRWRYLEAEWPLYGPFFFGVQIINEGQGAGAPSASTRPSDLMV